MDAQLSKILATPTKSTGLIYRNHPEATKNTLDKKIQCVLQGLGILNFDLAFKACTTLIKEYQGIPGFESKC